jgi:hypothetical protein
MEIERATEWRENRVQSLVQDGREAAEGLEKSTDVMAEGWR